MIKKINILLLAFMSLFSLSVTVKSNTVKASEESTTSREIKKSDKEFKLGTFYTPFNGNAGSAPYGNRPSDNTEENWKIMKDANFTFALPIYDTNDEQIITSLKNAEKVGLKIYVMDYGIPGIYNIINNNQGKSFDEVKAVLDANTDKLIERYNNFAKYESFAGLHAFDEPSIDAYNAIAACQDWWYEHFGDYEFFVNIFPSYASNGQLYGSYVDEGYIYRDYVNIFCETVNPSVISYDHYTLMKNGLSGYVRPQWLSDLEAFALASKKYEVPFQLYILTTQHYSYYAPEYYRDVAWQAYSAMCFGVKGIQTFTYWGYQKPYSDTNNLGDGVVDADGNPTPVYYACQEVFKEIQDMAEYYMNFNWVGTMTIGTSGSGTFALLTDSLEKVTGITEVVASEDALIGEFKDKDGNIAYMVNNYSLPYANKNNQITITFENTNKVLICKKGVKIVETLENNTLNLNMGSGEGYFIIPII